MRRWMATLLLLLPLWGCAGQESSLDEALRFRASLTQAGGCSFVGRITADFGDSVEVFTVSCRASAEGTTELTLLEPETLEGVTAVVSQDGGTVTYDGLMVEFGLLAQGNLIPAAAPAVVAGCWSSAYISCAASDADSYRVTYERDYEEKRLTVDTFFKNGLPYYAEVCYNQTCVLQMEISDYTMN